VLVLRLPAWGDVIALAGFLVTLAGVVFSGYLTAIEAFVLDAWCIYCIASASIMGALFACWLALLTGERRRLVSS
jgi:uncharacterized membrane protein